MAFQKLETDLKIISKLPDEPNEGGLTAAQLKAKFDEAGETVKLYLNETLIPEIEKEFKGKASQEDLENVALGQIPDGSITKEKLSPDAMEAALPKMSMNAPGHAQNVAAGFALGMTWIRPNYTLYNLAYSKAAEDFSVTACAVTKEEQMFTVAGNGDDKVISAELEHGSASGWLYCVVTPDASAVSAKLIAGENEIALTPGEETVIKHKYVGTGVTFEASYETANAAAAGTIIIENLTVIDEVATLEQVDAEHRDVTDDTVLNAANSSSPFATFEITADSWQHIKDGDWRTVGIRPKIIVSAPTGNIVTCSRGDIVLTAESVNRRCVFVVNDYGEWNVTTELPQGVETYVVDVTEVKIYNVAFSPKIKNYEMLYDNGVNGALIPNGFRDYDKTGDPGWCYLISNDNIPFSNYESMFIFCENKGGGNGGLYLSTGSIDTGTSADKWYFTTAKAKKTARVKTSGWGNIAFSFGAYASGATYSVATQEIGGTYLRTYLGGYLGNDGYWYTFALCHADNWEELASIAGISAASQTDLLSQSATLFQSIEAVTYLANACTGDFMAEAVLNSTFRSALNASEFSSVVYANEHWAKFLAMVA